MSRCSKNVCIFTLQNSYQDRLGEQQRPSLYMQRHTCPQPTHPTHQSDWLHCSLPQSKRPSMEDTTCPDNEAQKELAKGAIYSCNHSNEKVQLLDHQEFLEPHIKIKFETMTKKGSSRRNGTCRLKLIWVRRKHKESVKEGWSTPVIRRQPHILYGDCKLALSSQNTNHTPTATCIQHPPRQGTQILLPFHSKTHSDVEQGAIIPLTSNIWW